MIETMRRTMQFALYQWVSRIRNRDFWCTLFILGVFFSLYFRSAGAYVRNTAGEVGIFSVYPISMTNIDFILLVYAGLLSVVSDFADLSAGGEYSLLRIGKSVWYAGECISIILTTVSYFILIFILQLIFYFPNLAWSAEWGTSVENGTAFMGEFQLKISQSLLNENALHVGITAFVLTIFLGILFAMICSVFNLLGRGGGIGILLCSVMIMIDFFARQSGRDLGLLSPVGIIGSYYGGTHVTLRMGICYDILFIILCIFIGLELVKKKDFQAKRQGV